MGMLAWKYKTSDGITLGPGLVLRPWCELLHTWPTAKHSLDLYEPRLYLGHVKAAGFFKWKGSCPESTGL